VKDKVADDEDDRAKHAVEEIPHGVSDATLNACAEKNVRKKLAELP
jgi:hypothetical protein